MLDKVLPLALASLLLDVVAMYCTTWFFAPASEKAEFMLSEPFHRYQHGLSSFPGLFTSDLFIAAAVQNQGASRNRFAGIIDTLAVEIDCTNPYGNLFLSFRPGSDIAT